VLRFNALFVPGPSGPGLLQGNAGDARSVREAFQRAASVLQSRGSNVADSEPLFKRDVGRKNDYASFSRPSDSLSTNSLATTNLI
jgi:hypothetical protein